MSDKSKIEWTDATWNPVTGCTKVSQGCKNCYAERVFPRTYGSLRKFTDVRTHPDRLEQPLHWRKPRRVFVNSMSDLFHEDVPEVFIAAVFGVMLASRRHTFQVLTKRPALMFEFLTNVPDIMALTCSALDQAGIERGCGSAFDDGDDWPLENIWLGVSVEDQATASERIPLLLQTPAAVRFVSYEPALEWVDLKKYLLPTRGRPALDWLICGGESGPGARPFNVEWARSTIAQCKAAGVACFVKQLGANVACREEDMFQSTGDTELGWRAWLRDPKGGDMDEWPADLRVREFPDKTR